MGKPMTSAVSILVVWSVCQSWRQQIESAPAVGGSSPFSKLFSDKHLWSQWQGTKSQALFKPCEHGCHRIIFQPKLRIKGAFNNFGQLSHKHMQKNEMPKKNTYLSWQADLGNPTKRILCIESSSPFVARNHSHLSLPYLFSWFHTLLNNSQKAVGIIIPNRIT